MRGISDLDSVSLTEIFKNLTLLDLWSMRQCSKGFRNFVDDYFHSLYFVREQSLDLRAEMIENVNKILSNFGKFVRHLKVGHEPRQTNLILDMIARHCGGDVLKGLTLNGLHFYEIDMKGFAGVFNNLEFLEMTSCSGYQKCFENFLLQHEYPNLRTLRVKNSNVKTEAFKLFFVRKRNIKRLSCHCSDDLLPLIARNANEIEELDIWIQGAKISRDVMSVAQLRKLKVFKIYSNIWVDMSIIPLIKELAVNTEVEILDFGLLHNMTDEFWNALSNVTNLKELRFFSLSFTPNHTKSIEMLGQKLLKLESLILLNCYNFPYRNFLASVRNTDKFRKLYVWNFDLLRNDNFRPMVKDFIDWSGDHCFFSVNTLVIYLEEKMFLSMKRLLTQDNLKSIEKYNNIKIIRASHDVCSYDI